ncbi:hypothetical protein FQZ97_933420 [compost metagenome]
MPSALLISASRVFCSSLMRVVVWAISGLKWASTSGSALDLATASTRLMFSVVLCAHSLVAADRCSSTTTRSVAACEACKPFQASAVNTTSRASTLAKPRVRR